MQNKRRLQRMRVLAWAQVIALLLSTFSVYTPTVSAAPASAPAAAPSSLLDIVAVVAPAINKVFDVDGVITVTDMTATFVLPGATGSGFLQTRLWPVGEAGTDGQGLYPYLYRIDATGLDAVTAEACVTTMKIEFGPVVPMDYDGNGEPEEVFVITAGGLGSVGPTTVDQVGKDLTFTFAKPICPGDTSYFFGLASRDPYRDVTATLGGTLGFSDTLNARAPGYSERADGRIVYIYEEDRSAASEFKTLLESVGFSIDLVTLSNLLATNLAPYELAIVATDTGYLSNWGSAAGQAAHVAAAGIPVIGLNEGGYAYFGDHGLQIGWPNGWHGTDDEVRGVPGLSYYQTPADLTGLLGAPIGLYGGGAGMVSIHMPSAIAGVTPLGWETADNQHAPLIAEDRRDICNQLWGFEEDPLAMTPEGKRLFINAVHYGLDNCPGATDEPEPGCYELFSPREIPAPALIDFDDLADATVIGAHYQPSYGVTFDETRLTRVAAKANGTAVTPPNVARNEEADPDSGAAVALGFDFDEGKTHVGFYMGNGDGQDLPGAMVGYDAAGNVICQITNTPAPRPHSEFIGMYDPAGRIHRVTLNYGGVPVAESIDNLYFAPHENGGSGHQFPEAGSPLFGGEEMPVVEIETSTDTRFVAKATFPAAQMWAVLGLENEEYVQLGVPGIDPGAGLPGQPDVPVLRKLLAVPRGAEALVTGARAETADRLAATVYPSQPEAPDAPLNQNDDEPIPHEDFEDLPFAKDREAYVSDVPFPQHLVDVQKIGRIRDLDLVQVSIAAAQFFPTKGAVALYESVEFEIVFEGGEEGFLPEERSDNPFDGHESPVYELAMNSQTIYEYLFPIGDIVFGCVGMELLIITDPAFRPAADDLRTWKNSRGISTAIIETGNGPADAGTTATEIRQTIKDRYDDCHVRPSYVLLLGDAEYIPPFYRSTHYGDLAGTDLPYSTMDPDEFVPTPDLAVGRMPVDTLTQAQRVVDKVIDYEQAPHLGDGFYDDVTFAAYFQCCRPDVAQNGTTSRSFVETAELVRSYMDGQGYDTERIYSTSTTYHNNPAKPSYYDSSTRSTTPNRYYNGALLPVDLRAGSGYSWNGGSSAVIDAINDGSFLVFHRDHGGISGWGSPSFSSSHLNSLTNGNKLPVVYSVNCASGLFDNETRNPANDAYTYNTSVNGSYWAERILRMEGGAVGVIGDTRNSPTWANSAFARGLFDATWPGLLPGDGGATSIRRLGDIMNYGKLYMMGQIFQAQTAGSVSQSSAVTDMTLYHVYGDPSMKMWTSNPWQIALPWAIPELELVTSTFWQVHYAVNGAELTLLQDGKPIARAEVVDGVAAMNFVEELDPDAPYEMSAGLPGAISVALRLPDTTGEATPESGGGLTSPDGDLTVRFPPHVAPVPVDLFYDELPEPTQPIGIDWLAPVRSANAGPWMTTVFASEIFVLEAFDELGNPVTQFNGDYAMEVRYAPEALAEDDIDEMDQHCLYYDEDAERWRRIGTVVDPLAKVVTCSADHFTEFAVVGVKTTPDDTSDAQIFLPIAMK